MQPRHVFCQHCYRAVPAQGDTYVPAEHTDTRGAPCFGVNLAGSTTYSAGPPPCEREPQPVAPAALPCAADLWSVLCERTEEARRLRAQADRDTVEMERVTDLCLTLQAHRTQAENDARHAHSGWSQERAENRMLRSQAIVLRGCVVEYRDAAVATIAAERGADTAERAAARERYMNAAATLRRVLDGEEE